MISKVLDNIEIQSEISLPPLFKYNESEINKIIYGLPLDLMTEDNLTKSIIKKIDATNTKNQMIFNRVIFLEIYNLHILKKLKENYVNNDYINSMIQRYKEEQVIEFNSDIFSEIFNKDFWDMSLNQHKNICLYNNTCNFPGERLFSRDHINTLLDRIDRLMDDYLKYNDNI